MNIDRNWLKRQTEIVTNVSVLCAGAAAVITLFGGEFPPWYTQAQAAEESKKAAQIQQDTVQALGKLNDKIDRVEKRLDQSDCAHLATTLAMAQMRLQEAPGDAMARALRDSTASQMRQIPGCQ